MNIILSLMSEIQIVGGAWKGKRGLRGGGGDLNGQAVGMRECVIEYVCHESRRGGNCRGEGTVEGRKWGTNRNRV